MRPRGQEQEAHEAHVCSPGHEAQRPGGGTCSPARSASGPGGGTCSPAHQAQGEARAAHVGLMTHVMHLAQGGPTHTRSSSRRARWVDVMNTWVEMMNK